MTVEEKREHYYCGKYYVEARDLPSWDLIRHIKDPTVLDSWDSITTGKKVSFWEGYGCCLEIDVLACIYTKLLTLCPLDIDRVPEVPVRAVWIYTCVTVNVLLS